MWAREVPGELNLNGKKEQMKVYFLFSSILTPLAFSMAAGICDEEDRCGHRKTLGKPQ